MTQSQYIGLDVFSTPVKDLPSVSNIFRPGSDVLKIHVHEGVHIFYVKDMAALQKPRNGNGSCLFFCPYYPPALLALYTFERPDSGKTCA